MLVSCSMLSTNQRALTGHIFFFRSVSDGANICLSDLHRGRGRRQITRQQETLNSVVLKLKEKKIIIIHPRDGRSSPHDHTMEDDSGMSGEDIGNEESEYEDDVATGGLEAPEGGATGGTAGRDARVSVGNSVHLTTAP